MHKKTFKLFAGFDLKKILNIENKIIKKEIEKELENRILNNAKNEIIDYYYKKYHFEPILINIDKMRESRLIDKKSNMLVLECCIPFKGNPEILQYSPTNGIIGWTLDVYLNGSFFCFEKETYIKGSPDFKDEINEVLEVIKEETAKINKDVDDFNKGLKSYIENILKK